MRKNTDLDFWKRVDTSGGIAACWPWTGRCQPSGHGVYDHDGTWDYAHRYAYRLEFDAIELFVLHRCDNPPCCNFRHLYEGTQAQNVKDRDDRGRRDVRGERHPRAKLTDAQTVEIRKLYSTGRFTQAELGTQYGVHLSTISNVVRGKRKISVRSRGPARFEQ
jgi:hypothetical protein